MCRDYRSILLSLLSIFFAAAAFAQTGATPAKEDNLYSKALQASLSEMEKSWGHIDDSDGGRGIRTDYRHMLVEKVPDITDGLISQFGEYHVEYLDQQAQIDRYRKLRKQFSILRIHPIEDEGSRLKIIVSFSYLTYKNNKVVYGVSDWSSVEFRYGCATQSFVISNVKLGGI
ncbi:MAG: hypothetical protein WA789_16770 [Candidatus Acidiferrum sp.]